MARSTSSTGTTATSAGMDVLHQETGRIFRIAPKQSLADELGGPLRRSGQDDRRAARRAADEPERLARAARPRHPPAPRREAHAEAGHARRSCAGCSVPSGNPDRAAARDVGAARHRRLDAGRARAGARRRGRARPRLGGSAARRGSIAVPDRRSRSSRGWLARTRSPVVRLYLASALQRIDHVGALDARGGADDARARMPPITTCRR